MYDTTNTEPGEEDFAADQPARVLTTDELLADPVEHAMLVLGMGDDSARQATRNLAGRIRDQLGQLAQRVQGEQELARLEDQMAQARRKAAGRHNDDGEES